MNSHRLRFFTVLGLTLACLIALVFCAIFQAADLVTGAFSGALMLLVPAVIDASAVEKRRRVPGKKAVQDDVQAVGAGSGD